jgi:hypothetical protein
VQPAFQNLLLTIPGLRERLVELPAPGEALLAHLERATGPATRSAEIGFSLCSLALAGRVAEHVAILPDAAAEAAVRALAQARRWPIPALAIRQGDVVAQAMALPAAGFDRVILSAPLAFPAHFAALEAAMRALKVNGRLILRGAGVWTLEQSRNFLRADPAWGDAQPVGPDAFTFRKLAPHAAGPGDWARQPFVALNSGLAHAEAVKAQASFGLRNVVGDFFRPRPAAAPGPLRLLRLRQLRRRAVPPGLRPGLRRA